MSNTLLLIDDDVNFINTLQLGLKFYGYTIITSQDPKTGWKEMERCQPSIILLDWEMPGMSGIDFTNILLLRIVYPYMKKKTRLLLSCYPVFLLDIAIPFFL